MEQSLIFVSFHIFHFLSPLRGLSINEYFTSKIEFIVFQNQSSDTKVRYHSKSLGDLEYQIYTSYTEPFSNNQDYKSFIEYSVLLERKDNFLDEDDIKFPYNFGQREIILIVKEIKAIMEKNGLIKDRKYLLKTTTNVFYANDIIQSTLDVLRKGKYPQFGSSALKIDVITFLKLLCEIGFVINKQDKGHITENAKDYLKFAKPEDYESLSKIFMEKKESLFKPKKEVIIPTLLKQTKYNSLKQLTQINQKVSLHRSFDIGILKKPSSDKKIPVKKELQIALSNKRKSKIVNNSTLKKEDSAFMNHLKDVLKVSPSTSNEYTEDQDIPDIEITLIDDQNSEDTQVEVIHTNNSETFDDLSTSKSSYNDSSSLNTNLGSSMNEKLNDPQSMENDSILKTIDSNDINDKIYTFVLKKDMENFKKLVDQIDAKWRHPVEYKTFLHAAVLSGSLSMTELLISKGVDVNECDKISRTPLMYASSLGLREISIFLLGNGAKVTLKDSYGFSPLLLALKGHFFDLCSDLILFGADINMKRDNGMTPLIEAVQASDSEMANYILSLKNVKMNLKDQNGKSALLKSFENGSLNIIIKLLTNSGVDTSSVDDHGRNMFHYLAKNNRVDVLEYLSTLEVSDLNTKYSKLMILPDYKKKSTPLHLAVNMLNSDLVKDMILLFDLLQINSNIKDSENYTPYDLIFNKIEKEYMNLKGINPSLQGDKILEKIERELLQIEEILYPSSQFELK